MTLLTDHDIYLFKQGNHFRLYEKLGSHPAQEGTEFAVWAPNAKAVSVIGDFNQWNPQANPLEVRLDGSGIWEGSVAGVQAGTAYKYHIVSRVRDYEVDKGDPYAYRWESPPQTASVVWSLDYEWNDDGWMQNRRAHNSIDSSWAIYEVHLGSWRRVPEEGNRPLGYRELAHQLADYVRQMGFTHVELLPVMEHPFYGSWGYQQTGYFAPTARYGSPQDFMYFVEHMHQSGIGVILDWVPSHFPQNENGLVYFDGTNLYEHSDPRKGFHPDWKSYIFNYGRWEVRAFLVSSALFWLDKYHIDGLRVDGVASMLYLDYSRKEGEWVPNKFGGRENLEAVDLLKTFNRTVYENYPDVQTIAEESTAWPMVSRPTYLGGLGFGMKWNMGWMHDTLDYFSKDSIYRKYAHNNITFSIWYAFSENFILSLSHDEVVHGKGSLINKMPGDAWQKAASLRSLFGYMYAHPGKKLLFMGGEFGMWREWNHDSALDWHLLEFPLHQGIQKWMKDLNHFYQNEPALYEVDFQNEGFEWMDFHDWEQSVISFVRKNKQQNRFVLVVCNFTPVLRHQYRISVPLAGFWKEALNSDAIEYGGSGQGNYGGLTSFNDPKSPTGKTDMLSLTLPPLSITYFTLQKAHESASTEALEIAAS